MKFGFDIGSRNLGCAALDHSEIVETWVIPHNGDPAGAFHRLVEEIFGKYGKTSVGCFGITGSLDLESLNRIDPVLAAVEANSFLDTGCRNILSIGCETFSLILLDGDFRYVEHTVNSDCASGTGSFIDQQAERLGFTTEELAGKASSYEGDVPSIATRCAVFAESDIVHAQARGFSKEAIAAGICEGVARSVLANTIKGRELAGGVVFTGGVSRNRKIVSEIARLLGTDVSVPVESQAFNSIGAALLGEDRGLDPDRMLRGAGRERARRKGLRIALTDYPDFDRDRSFEEDGVEITLYQDVSSEGYSVYLGIDIGSTSTKAIVLDENGTILVGVYTRTEGDPVGAAGRLFTKIGDLFRKGGVEILGVGTTGSGRNLVRDVIGADLAINEITAHAKGATFLDPDVDTIIEIGGQDSKFTLIRDGSVIAVTMNYACAAGTGSFIEEQAKRLGITLDEISELALGQEAPYTSDRCTVYMERDLNLFLSEGWDRRQIITAVLHSVRDNYLSRVVGRSPLGDRIYFQGATARNKALVAAFENEIGKPISVSRFCHLTGALGVALHLRDTGLRNSAFTGIDFSFTTRRELCTLCANHCDLRVYEAGGRTTAWGLKCGRDYEDKQVRTGGDVSYLEQRFAAVFGSTAGNERIPIAGRGIVEGIRRGGETPAEDDSATRKGEKAEADRGDGQIVVGIPAALYMVEYAPLFRDFFEKLGVGVIIEHGSPSRLKSGMSLINSDFCAPMVLTHGIIKSLLDGGADYIFFPAFVNEQSYMSRLSREEKFTDKKGDCYFCYYSQYAPTIVSNLTTIDPGKRLISPMVKLNNRPVEVVADEIARSLEDVLAAPSERIAGVFLDSYREFRARKAVWRQEGERILASRKGRIKILLLGRPYAIFDRAINLGIPAKLESMGFDILFQTMLDLTYEKDDGPDTFLDRMHWYYGQQIMLATEATVMRDDVYPVFLSCFRCSPDSYLITYFRETMKKAGKPYLILQLDEHASDVGYQTRIEAGIETFLTHFDKKRRGAGEEVMECGDTAATPETKIPLRKRIRRPYRNDSITKEDTVLIPYLSPVISELQRVAFEAHGYTAIVMPLEQKMINLGYRYASGGECMPNVAIAGSLIETVAREKLDPTRSVLHLPTICMGCNFNQFSTLIDIACENAGLKGMKIANSNAAAKIPELSKELNVDLLSVNILGSLLYKLYFRFRPYEVEKGETDRVLKRSTRLIEECLRRRKPLSAAAEEIRRLFDAQPVHGERRPRVGILGDLYVKYNAVLNEDIYSLVEELGGEVLIPSFTETVAHFIDADVRENDLHRKYLKGLVFFEKRFERIFSGLLDDSFEPPLDECIELMRQFGIEHFIAGETTVNVSRMLYYVRHDIVSAVIHINPVFCCPGVVSSSIFRRIQKEFGVPIIDLFYDGTNRPNRIIVPHMYYLTRNSRGSIRNRAR